MGAFDFLFGDGKANIDPNVGTQVGNINTMSKIVGDQAQAAYDTNQSLYNPVTKQYVNDALNYDSQANQDAAAANAGATVRSTFGKSNATYARYLASMGINPNSGRALSGANTNQIAEAAAEADANNQARQTVRDTGINLRSGVVQQGNTATNQVLQGQQLALGGYNNSANLSLGVTKANMDALAARNDMIGTTIGAGLGVWAAKK